MHPKKNRPGVAAPGAADCKAKRRSNRSASTAAKRKGAAPQADGLPAVLDLRGNYPACGTRGNTCVQFRGGHSMKADKKLAQTAQRYRDNHHWVPLRLQGKSPDCMGKGWQKRRLTDAIPKFEQGDNLGVLVGEPSGWLARLDPDFPAIPTVTEILFPEPTSIFGRKSSPRSGRLYICEGLRVPISNCQTR